MEEEVFDVVNGGGGGGGSSGFMVADSADSQLTQCVKQKVIQWLMLHQWIQHCRVVVK